MTQELTSQHGKQLEITEKEGKTTIVFRKAILRGKVSNSDVLNTLLIAAKLQAEGYIKKLSTGSLLEAHEVKALKELAEICKLEIQVDNVKQPQDSITTDVIKSNLYTALAEKLALSSDKDK